MLFLNLILSGILTTSTAHASQGLLDCHGPNLNLEAWFQGNPQPEEIYAYGIDPHLGVPSQYRSLYFHRSSAKLEFALSPIDADEPILRFVLTASVNGGYSGSLWIERGSIIKIFQGYHCAFL